MCSHYQAIKTRARLEKMGVILPEGWVPPHELHIYKRFSALFIRKPRPADGNEEALPGRELVNGEFGLLPHWSPGRVLKFDTLNARSETASTTASYRLPWAQRHCIIPADWVNEPDWRSGKCVDTRIERADGEPMGIAGLWDAWRHPETGEVVRSFTMLTINADAHPLMNRFHRPGKEKRMVVILREADYTDWLDARAQESMAFMKPFPAEELVASAADPAKAAETEDAPQKAWW
ncbi:MAG: SOS response-associated peptidase family protein [Pseudomonadota bacterium]